MEDQNLYFRSTLGNPLKPGAYCNSSIEREFTYPVHSLKLCSSLVFSVFTVVRPSPLSISEHFIVPQRNPAAVNSHSSSAPAPGNRWSTLSMDSPFLDISCRQNHGIRALLWLAYLIEHHVFKVHTVVGPLLGYFLWLNNIPRCGWTTFYLSIRSGCTFAPLWFWWTMLLWTFVHKVFCGHVFEPFGDTHISIWKHWVQYFFFNKGNQKQLD